MILKNDVFHFKEEPIVSPKMFTVNTLGPEGQAVNMQQNISSLIPPLHSALIRNYPFTTRSKLALNILSLTHSNTLSFHTHTKESNTST